MTGKSHSTYTMMQAVLSINNNTKLTSDWQSGETLGWTELKFSRRTVSSVAWRNLSRRWDFNKSCKEVAQRDLSVHCTFSFFFFVWAFSACKLRFENRLKIQIVLQQLVKSCLSAGEIEACHSAFAPAICRGSDMSLWGYLCEIKGSNNVCMCVCWMEDLF